jgi:hypothetical protein
MRHATPGFRLDLAQRPASLRDGASPACSSAAARKGSSLGVRSRRTGAPAKSRIIELDQRIRTAPDAVFGLAACPPGGQPCKEQMR